MKPNLKIIRATHRPVGFQPGHTILVTHGKSRTRIYKAWHAMKARCENPNSAAYHHYGGRGIYVCDEWQTFEGFYRDMGERPEGTSLDRIDNDGPYAPWNCRWADKRTQASNRRVSRKITVNGQTKTLVEWAEALGLPDGTISHRLNRLGWTEEAAVTTPRINACDTLKGCDERRKNDG